MKKHIQHRNFYLDIYIEDTDFQGFVYHANYLKFFERARSNFLLENGIFHKHLKQSNLAFVVKSVKVDFLLPAKLEDSLVVKTFIEKKSNARMVFHQSINNLEDDKVLCNGIIEVCLINLVTKKPQILPDDLLLIFNKGELNE
jgi:acyl-CoA thioester hydrolase